MIKNLYKIQIKKRLVFNFVYWIALIVILCLIFTSFLVFIDWTKNGSIKIDSIITTAFAITIYFGGMMILLLFIQLVWTSLYLNSIQYVLTNKNLIFKGGVISRFEKIIPLSKIQHVIIYESFWQRILGLSSVSIETAREGGLSKGASRYQPNTYNRTGPLIPDLKTKDSKTLKDKIISTSNLKYRPVAGV